MVRFKAGLDRVMGSILAFLMGVAVLNVLWQVFTRFVLADPSSFTDELARFLLIWIGILGAAYVAGRRMHLAIDLLPTLLKGRAHAALGLFIELCITLFALFVLVLGGWQLVSLQLLLGQISAALQLPLGYIYTVLPLSGALIIVYSVLFMADYARILRGQDPLLVTVPTQTPEEDA